MGEERRETFEVAGKVKVTLKNLPSGRASFLPGEAGKVEVHVRGKNAGDFAIERFGEEIELRAPEGRSSRWDAFEVTVRVPEDGASLGANVAAADVDVEVGLESLGFNSASGDLRARRVAGETGANTASGSVSVESVGGRLGVNTASGDVKVGEARGEVGVNTASGDVRVESALADLEVRSASGDLEVRSFDGKSLKFNTQAGDVKILVPPGRTLDVDFDTLAGDIKNELGEFESSDSSGEEPGEGAPARLRVKTLSGDITLGRTANGG